MVVSVLPESGKTAYASEVLENSVELETDASGEQTEEPGESALSEESGEAEEAEQEIAGNLNEEQTESLQVEKMNGG